MIEVRIRYDYESEAVHLCDWAADGLHRLLSSIGKWGIFGEAGEHNTSDLTGQIVLGETDAYFEIIVVTENDS